MKKQMWKKNMVAINLAEKLNIKAVVERAAKKKICTVCHLFFSGVNL